MFELLAETNYGGDAGEFKRSASARLHRNKRNHPDIFGDPNLVIGVPSHNGNIPDDCRRKEQVSTFKSFIIISHLFNLYFVDKNFKVIKTGILPNRKTIVYYSERNQ